MRRRRVRGFFTSVAFELTEIQSYRDNGGVTADALERMDHRPWPMPERRWTMAQRWHDLLFAHWPVRPERMRALVPDAFELDLFDGDAWVGIVPFRMTGIRHRLTPPLPWISAFCEINVRTYVKVGDKPGVFFFSLDASNPVAVAVAQRWFHLPYFNAKMSLRDDGTTIRYASRRSHGNGPEGEFRARYRPTSDPYAAVSGTLEHWLTERYCLYSIDSKGGIHRGEIQHAPWPLQKAEAEIEVNTLARGHGIEHDRTEPLLHFARELSVVVWSIASC